MINSVNMVKASQVTAVVSHYISAVEIWCLVQLLFNGIHTYRMVEMMNRT